MKRKWFVRPLVLCLATPLLAGTLLARQTSSDAASQGAGSPGAASSSAGGSYLSAQKPERLSQLTGSSIKSSSGESIGQINDFIINPASGRIQFAVVSLTDQSGKLTAVPWQLVRPGTEPNTFSLTVDKEKLASAQTFDATSWPDFSQPEWSRRVYSHYGIQMPGRMGGRIPTSGSERGSGTSGTGQESTSPKR